MIHHVSNPTAAASTTAQTATPKPVDFKGWPVVDGKIQDNRWLAGWRSASTLETVQKEFVEEAKKAADVAKAANKDAPAVSWWKAPFIRVGNVLNTVYSAIADLLKSIFSPCIPAKAPVAPVAPVVGKTAK